MNPVLSDATIWVVDPSGTYPTPNAVRNLVEDGDTIHIRSAVYTNHPQVYFAQNNLLIKGIDGRPRLEAGSALSSKSNGKALFVIGGKDVVVENIEFANASVPDNNGAGIRQEGCDLIVRYCYFNSNEMGILGGNYSPCKVLIEYCEFANNGNSKNPGFQHNVYINHIDTLIFRYNYSIDAIAQGHEIKSSAHNNIIAYNYIANISSDDSRTIDLPNGGNALLIGNIVEQGENSVNSNILGYGLEGLSNPEPHVLRVINNSFVNKKSKGIFVQVKDQTDSLILYNNILVGRKTGGLILGSPLVLDSSNNFVHDDPSSVQFVELSAGDYHLTTSSPTIDKGIGTQYKWGTYSLIPNSEYRSKARFDARRSNRQIDIGAYEYLGDLSSIHHNPKQLSIFPNPTSTGYIELRGVQNIEYDVISIDGEFVQSGLIRQGKIYLPSLIPGKYFVMVESIAYPVYVVR